LSFYFPLPTQPSLSFLTLFLLFVVVVTFLGGQEGNKLKLLRHVVFLALGCEVWLFLHLGLIQLIKRIWFHFEVFAIFWKAGVLINNCCCNWGLSEEL
jgi:hypothetical protein